MAGAYPNRLKAELQTKDFNWPTNFSVGCDSGISTVRWTKIRRARVRS